MKKISCYLILILLISFSCRKKIEKPGWDVDAFFPIASTTLKITDLVKDTLLKINPDKSLSVVYSGEVYKLNFDSLFKIPDTSIFQSFRCFFCGAGILYPPGGTFINQTQNTKYNLNNVELVEVIIRSGSIDVQLMSTFKGKTLLTYQMPLATLNGVPLSVTDTLPAAAPNDSAIITKSYNLAGYKIDLRGINGNNFNTVVSSFKAVTIDATTVTNNDSVRIKNTFKSIIPEFARGYFGEVVENILPTNKAVHKLHNITGGTIDLKYLDLTMKIRNGIGVDIRFLLNQIISSSISPASNVSLNSAVIGSALNINRAFINSSTTYPPITYSEYIIKMNSSNSNADALIEINPDSIAAGAGITLNPLGNVSNSNDFVYYGNGINVSLDAELPLCFIANNLTLVDTVAINFKPKDENAKDGSENILGGNLILDAYNSYPFKAKPQLYLMNETYQVTDSLVAENSMIEAAALDANFKSVGKKLSRVYIPVSQDKIKALKAAKYIMLKFSFTTAGQPNYVKIYSDYSMYVKLVADINYEVKN